MSDKTLSLVNTKNFDVVTDDTFSSVAIGELFDKINIKLAIHLVFNQDALLHY
jgi:hypothetical protein